MNNVAYFEIHVDDPQKAVVFYEEVFGWKVTKGENLPFQLNTSGAEINK